MLLSSLLGLPLAPVRGVGWLAKVLQEQAEHQLYDPAAVWRQLEDLEAAAAEGQITPEELAEQQQQVIDRLIA